METLSLTCVTAEWNVINRFLETGTLLEKISLMAFYNKVSITRLVPFCFQALPNKDISSKIQKATPGAEINNLEKRLSQNSCP